MKRALLGCGYVGVSLLKYWKDKHFSVIVTTTTKNRQPLLESLADEVQVLISDNLPALKQLLKCVNYCIVMVAPKKDKDYKTTYLQTAQSLSQVMQEIDWQGHLIYTSATSVYGDHRGNIVNETSELKPENDNAKILCQTEQIYLNLASSRIKVSILRLGGIFGPGRKFSSMIRSMAGTTVPGSSTSFCNFVHLEDIIHAIDWICTHQLNGVYNICCSDHPTKGEFYNQVLEKHSLPPIEWNESIKTTHGGNKKVSNNKIKSTGFNFLHRCSEAI